MKWKPVGIAFLLALSVFFGVFTMQGSDLAKGTTVSGHISVDTIWDLDGSPYIVVENVVVDPGVNLTIEPGVEVRFTVPPLIDYFSLFVEGNLISIGEASLPIVFTSNGASPQVGDWHAIQINSSGYAEISFSRITYSTRGVFAYSSGNIVTNNYMSNNGDAIELGTPASRNYIANNTAVDNVGGFLGMGAASYNIIKNNTILNSPASIYGYDPWSNTIVDNTIINSMEAIRFDWSANSNTISRNTIVNASRYGIYLFGAGSDIVENNTISLHSNGIGIQLDPGHVFIANNTITNCQHAVYFGGWTNNNTLIDNTISENEYGFSVWSSNDNTFIRNEIISNSRIGLRMVASINNLVYHNSFINNTIHASDTNNDTFWDGGYPIGGNYWSDYDGNDTFYGPNQNIPGSDGIGDTPHPINISEIDRYPLTEPTTGYLPPRNVNIYLSGMNYENVTLTWNPSWNDGQRTNDVTGYEIHRSSTYDKEGIGYSLIGSTPNQTTQYVDSYSGEGNPNNYFYYVCAINGTGNSSCSSDQAGKFTRPLFIGPNLVSIPLIQSDETIQTVLQTLSYNNAWSYDPINQEWKSYMKSKPYGQSLEYLNHTMGIWVNVTQDSNLTVAGVVPTSTTINLQAGWNLVGFPSFDDNFTVADLKAVIAVERIEGFDGLAPPYFLRVMTDGDFLLAGFAYWIRIESPAIWTVENT